MNTIHALATAVPPYAYHQDYAADCMKRWVKDKAMRRMVTHLYRQSGIERRFSVVPDFQPGATARLFRESPDGTLLEPTTGERNRFYQETYPAVLMEAVRRVLATAPWIDPGAITHVITVSCTGFGNPGPDLLITRGLGLSGSVERYHLGFMGCYAAFPALRMADQFCAARPDAVVLVACIELCSLHLQIKPTTDMLLANALFADGAAAALVSRRPLPAGKRGLELHHFATRLIPDSAEEMAWSIGDRGFDMILSSYVPRILGLHARDLLNDVLGGLPPGCRDVSEWAVHPGGKAILQALAQHMAWDPSRGALRAAHEVLRDYGNMSSATIMFVWKAMLEAADIEEGALVGSLAFGPGLTVEFGLMQVCGKPVTSETVAPHHALGGVPGP